MSVRLCLDAPLTVNGVFTPGACTPQCKKMGRVAYIAIPDTPATRAVLAEAKEFVHANPTVEERVIADLLALFEKTP